MSPNFHYRNGNSITCDQERFILFEETSNDDDDRSDQEPAYKWWVPLSYTTAGGDFSDTERKFWLRPDDGGPVDFDVTADESEALIINVQQTGYYRVNYDVDNWNMISASLEQNFEDIDRINRAQVLNDALSLARGGLLDYTVALETTK